MAGEPIGRMGVVGRRPERGTRDLGGFSPSRELVGDVVPTIAVPWKSFVCASVCVLFVSVRFIIDEDDCSIVIRAEMLTDMTPGHLYGAQIPGMTVNVKTTVSTWA